MIYIFSQSIERLTHFAFLKLYQIYYYIYINFIFKSFLLKCLDSSQFSLILIPILNFVILDLTIKGFMPNMSAPLTTAKEG